MEERQLRGSQVSPSDGLFHCRVSEVISTKLGMAVALSYSAFEEGVVN